MRRIIGKYKIKHRKYSPYHQQTNGLMESIKKVLEVIMVKIFQLFGMCYIPSTTKIRHCTVHWVQRGVHEGCGGGDNPPCLGFCRVAVAPLHRVQDNTPWLHFLCKPNNSWVDPRMGGGPKDGGWAYPWFCAWFLSTMFFAHGICRSSQGKYGYILIQG